MKKRYNLKRGARLLLLPLFLGAATAGTHAQISSFTHTYVANNGFSRVDQNNSNMIITPYMGSDKYKGGYLVVSNVESGGVLAVKVTAVHPTAGAQHWSKIYMGYGSGTYGNTRCFAITRDTRDNGYVLTGYRNNTDTKRDELWAMKIDADGNFIDDYSFTADNIPCTSDGPLEQPCEIFKEPSFYGMDIVQVHNDPDTPMNGDFVIVGFMSHKPGVEEPAVLKRSFVWRFAMPRFGPATQLSPVFHTRYLKVFHWGNGSAGIEPTPEDFTYEIQEMPKYGLMLLGQINSGRIIPIPPTAPPRRPYYALLNYDGGGLSNLSSNVFRYANFTSSTASKNVRTLYGKDDVIYMLGYYFPTRSFTITPIKPASGGAGLTRIYFAPNVQDMPAFSMYQSRNNSDELVVMGYRLGLNEPVRSDYVHPYNIMVSKGGNILTKFNLETIRSPKYVSYIPTGTVDYFRPFDGGFPVATMPEIGTLDNHLGYNDAAVAGVLFRGFTSSIERFHATVTQYKSITEDAECHPYHLSPDKDSIQFRYGALTFNINSFEFTQTPYLTVVSEPTSDYGCIDIPQQRPSGTGTIVADQSFSLYPNPAHNELMIRYGGDNQEMQVAIQDITGRVLFTEEKVMLGQQPYALGTAQLAPGVYVIAITNAEGHSERFKIVKE